MPYPRVSIDASSTTSYVPRETFNDIIVFARTQSEPTNVAYNEQLIYRKASDVANDLGDGSDAHAAAQALDAMGTSQYRYIVVEQTSVSGEVIGDSDTATTSSGSVQNAPISGDEDVSVSLDGSALTTVYTTDSPPDANETPATGEAYVNTDTGEVVTSDSTSGTGAGIEVDYAYNDWTSAFAALDAEELDLATMANVHADASYIGDMDAIVTWGASNYVHATFATENGANYADDQAFLDAAQPVAAYAPSADASMTAHKASDDVASYVVGGMATQYVWADPSMEEGGYPGLSADSIDKTLIGDPETTGTFEGGQAQSDGTEHQGAMNVLENVAGTWVLSNDLTTVGNSSAYKYLDRRRTEGFVKRKATAALVSLALRQDIPFNKRGKVLIENALRNVLGRYSTSTYSDRKNRNRQRTVTERTKDIQQSDSQSLNATVRSPLPKSGSRRSGSAYPRRGPYQELQIDVPPADQIDQSLRDNRIWGIITVTYVLNGSVHRFELDIEQRTQAIPGEFAILPGGAPTQQGSISQGSEVTNSS